MLKQLALLAVLAFPIASSFIHPAFAEPGASRVYETQQGRIYLAFGQELTELAPSGPHGALEPVFTLGPGELARLRPMIGLADLAYRLRRGARSAAAIDTLLRSRSHASYGQMLLQAARLCLADQDRACLAAALSLSPSTRVSEALLSLDLAAAPSMTAARERLSAAARAHPGAEWVARAGRDFQLGSAAAALRAYRGEHLRAGIHARTGMNTMEDGRLSLGDSYRELAFNTVNWARVALLGGRAGLEREWREQQALLTRLERAIEGLRQSMAAEPAAGFGELAAASDAWGLPYVRELARDPVGLPAPTLRRLGFEPETELVRVGWAHALLEEANLFNLATFATGPALLKAFGATAAGAWTVRALRLRRLTAALARLPRPLDSVAMFLAIETADGCTLRWGYMLYKAGERI